MNDQEVRVNFRYSLVPDGNTAQDVMGQLESARRASQGIESGATPVIDENRLTLNKFLAGLNRDTSILSGDDKKNADLTKFIGEQFDKISQTMTKGVNMAFGVIDDIYKEMKKSSPLLQTLESLFNLAMQLFFMPLGNKLAEVLLPAVINLVETSAKMWDELGNGNLNTIFQYAIQYGINALAGFFKETGSLLKEQGGLLGAIGSIMTTVGNFIENGLVHVLELILNAVNFVMQHLKEIIAAIVAFKVASLMMQMVTTAAIIAGSQQIMGNSVGAPVAAGILANGAALTVGAATVAGAGTYFGLDSLGLADGGVVKHTPGGRLITVAENEDEVIMPKSKAGMGGNVTNNFYGYTSDDIREMIDRSVSEKISLSYIKGGY